MDPLTAFLDGPRANSAFLLRCVMSPPWCLHVRDEAPITVLGVVRGTAWVVPDGGKPEMLAPGDLAVVRGPGHYKIADDVRTPPQAIISPGQHCTTLRGEPLAEAMHLGVRTWGNDLGGESVMLVGTYETDAHVARRLVETLPPLIVDRGPWDSPLIEMLGQEIVKDEPGQQAVLDRILDLLVVTLLRRWFSREDGDKPAWYRAHDDEVIGPALRLLHNDPARPWTVERLADEVNVSRATLARRFRDFVGEPPMTYLTKWRMTLAADLLLERGALVGAVARQVGYENPFTFSTAFKRLHGSSPRAYRERASPG
ncbi:MAG: AraC family transcriptional regulator [Planctomycetota bacterium]